jgi:hypothetical protein
MVDNKVGDKLLPDAKALKLLKTLLETIDELRNVGITLKVGTKLSYPRKGAAAHMQTVHDLAIKHGLTVKNAPLEGMQRDIALSKQIQPFANALRAGLKLAEDTMAQADSESWGAFLAHYALLSALADRDPEVAIEMASVIDFMSTGPRQDPTPQTAATT